MLPAATDDFGFTSGGGEYPILYSDQSAPVTQEANKQLEGETAAMIKDATDFH